MLIRFAFENFRSIRDRQELSLVASRLRGLAQATIELRDQGADLLRAVAIYGGNASGKTNVLRALHFVAGAVTNSQRLWKPEGGIPREYFLLRPDASKQPSTFELDLIVASTRYRYGFSVNSVEVLREYLFAYPKGRKQTWFERDSRLKQPFRFGPQLLGENRTIQNLTRPNSLFLSAAAQNQHAQLLPLFHWFSQGVAFVNPSTRNVNQELTALLCENEASRAKLLQFLSAADLGITGVEVKEAKPDEKLAKAFRGFLVALRPEDGGTAEPELPRLHDIAFRHQAGARDAVVLPSHEESEGTRALFSLAGPMFRALSAGALLCVDELDASLHPLLALEVVKAFNSSESNPHGAQLVFNTHDTNLLDRSILRRDQIWFTEKDGEGATHLYPLSDFQPRRDESLERGYLQGRYGAVPVFGDSLAARLSDG